MMDIRDKALSSHKVQRCISDIENKLKGSGRLIIRKSGTEPLIRITIEHDNQSICDQYAKMIADLLKMEMNSSDIK